MDSEYHAIDDQPVIKQLLAEGVSPSEIWVVDCPYCGNQTYYDGGQSCRCFWCKRRIPDAYLEEVYTLEDYWTMPIPEI
jgi:hypothetical protein